MAPSPTPSSSKKLLITEPKPKSVLPPNSASSSSTTATPPPEKRTRDQPNLSDCHCCGRRINHTNPKDRLQPLDSVWRVVLLCRKCRKNVHSGQMCTYCFQETVNSGDLFRCSVCERKIHKDCARDYGNWTPWCYLGAGLEGFRVCVDCWVPELLKNSIKGCGRSENKGGLKDRGEGRDLLEKVVKDAKSDMERSVKMVANAKEQKLRRAKGAKNAVDLANGASDLLAKTDRDGSKAENSNCNAAIGVVDDAELAIHLHRAINSSPRILRSKSLVNSSALDVLQIRDWNGLSYKRSRLGKNHGEGQMLGTCANDVENERINQPGENASRVNVNRLNLGLLPYKRDRKRKIWWDGLSYKSSCLGKNCVEGQMLGACANDVENERINQPGENALCVNVNSRLNLGLLPYKRDRKRKIWQLDDQNTVDTESRSSQPADLKFNLLHSDDAGTRGLMKCGADILEASICVNTDRCNSCVNVGRFGKELVSYRRTRFRQKVCEVNGLGDISGECSSLDDHRMAFKESESSGSDDAKLRTGSLGKSDTAVILPNGTCDLQRDRYHLKYGKRGTKSGSSLLCSGTFLSKNQVSAPSLSNSETGYSAKCDVELILPNGSSNQDPDRYCFKYSKRVKGSQSGSSFEVQLHSDAFLNEIVAAAPGVTTNCSAESRTLSDVSFDSLTIDCDQMM
ncbi:uncharacterized protein LOC105172586 [Sesamum indicum]|uniref:Uncharacterized protein LOC105172586 n=1 Tax=Sesamum indicum TaxID=4182 RepID=A0A6I9U473_SESIN|nr:uncharacterized protein LOC105172586 [Sesamum indicum]